MNNWHEMNYKIISLGTFSIFPHDMFCVCINVRSWDANGKKEHLNVHKATLQLHHNSNVREINVHMKKKIHLACPEIPAKYGFNGGTAPLYRNMISSREIDLILESYF